MSVDVSVYSLVGLKIKPEDMEYTMDRYNELYANGDHAVDCVDDCMCGEYAYVGIVLSNVDVYDPEPEVSVPLYDKTFSAEHVAGLIRKAYPELIFESTDIAFYSFSHFH